jgi:16S rRNA (guanine527-N7)-methyltransferase
MTGESPSRLAGRADAAGIRLDGALLDRLVHYYDLLFRWNQTINLTSFEDSDAAVDKLIVEPLAAAAYLPRAGAVMDVGSGGGSPAVPLALALGARRLVMVESRTRKASFLREVIRELRLDAIVEGARVEELAHREDLLRKMDVVSIRAVRPDLPFLGGLASFLSPSGRLGIFIGEMDPLLPSVLEQVEVAPLISHLHSRLLVAAPKRPDMPDRG